MSNTHDGFADLYSRYFVSDQKKMGRQLPPSMWNPTDWSYAAEGGKHAIFRYSGIDCDFFGHVLRIAKSDLACASSENDGGESASSLRTCKVIEFMEESASPSQTFHRRVVQPLIGHCYLDLARLIRLPAACCAHLYHSTLASGLIPPSRLPSWKIGNTKDSREGVKATLLRDHTHLSRHPRLLSLPASISDNYNIIDSRSITVLSVEIKPKAGYITASPLVLPVHRCKYYRTRYSLQQELMQMGHVQKGWRTMKTGDEKKQSTENSKMQDVFTPSNYSPLDLFFPNIIRTQKALKDLSQNMQNNFRVWCNGKKIFGEYETPSNTVCQKILDDICHNSGSDGKVLLPDPKSTLLDVITRTVSQVLERESLLSNILSMQQLDVIDGDGAVKVYERLVHLCKGSNLEAEKLLDEAALLARDGLVLGQGASTSSLFYSDSSPYIMHECDSLENLLDEIVQFQTHLRKRMQEGSSPNEEILDASHARCIECVNDLSKEACIYLLQNWLLSLALCDVSFFVSFQFLMDQEHEATEECQSCDHGGIAICSMQDDVLASRAMGVHYEVKIVDCDPKPAKKLHGRGEVESKFQFIDK